MTLQFEYPWILYLLWLAPLAGVLAHVLMTRRPAAAGFLSPAMAARLAPPPTPGRRTWQTVLGSTALLLALVALARPQWGSREETVYQRGRDLMLVLDVSRSMLARDVHPSRLGRAKVDLMDLVKQLRGDRVGLLAFRGRPVLLCPLTTDYAYLSQVMEGVDVDSAPMGETNIGDAILKAMETFEGDEGSHRAIVLVSDGDDLSGRVDAAVEKAREQGVAVFTVGLGSTEGSRIPAPAGAQAFMTYQGAEVTSKLNHQVMQAIAEKTGGAYVPVGVANVKLGDLYRDHLSRLSARELEESVQRRAIERFQLFLFPAVLCLLVAAFLSRGQTLLRQRTNPPPVPPPAIRTAVLLLAALAGTLHAADTNGPPVPEGPRPVVADTNVPSGRSGALKAQALYVAGRYEEAAGAYLGAARHAVRRPRFDYLYNAGCALLKAGRNQEAADTFRSLLALEDATLADASYNLGIALHEAAATSSAGKGQPDAAGADARVDALQQSVAAFQRSARLAPDDADSRRNLAVVSAKTLQARDEARLAKVLAAHGQTPPDALADLMLQQQRQLLRDLPAAFTNTTPARIQALEDLAARQDDTADLMIALKGKLLEALARQPPATASNAPSPQQMAAHINGFAESIRDTMGATAETLRDLDPSADPRARQAETSVYNLWKGVAGYGMLLREDILRQTNAITLAAPRAAAADAAQLTALRQEQSEAAELTSLFRSRFGQTVPPEGLSVPAPAATNDAAAATNVMKQILSPEDRTKILALSDQALAAQEKAVAAAGPDAALPHQRLSHDLLKEIEKLLPKQDSPSQQQQKPSEQPQDQKEQPQNQPPPKPEESKPEPKPDKEEKKPEAMARDDVQRMLEKARQREKDHEMEKRQREAYAPLSPVDRDW
jgi:Ca-activated chloride channel family protein